MKKHASTVVLILIFLLGLCILLYPIVANWWNSKVQVQVIANYESVIQQIDQNYYEKYFREADAFNEKLRSMEAPLYHAEELTDYMDVLNIDGNGVMGYLNIEKLRVELPVYHTALPDVLNSGVGHIEGSSLPVGGKGTHCALSAHRGLPSAKLFSDLDEMEIGDIFTMTVLDRLMTYQVDQIKIVLPQELEELTIDPEQDYLTLVTCTPYGINTHRLLVRGTRVDNISVKPQLYVPNEAIKVDPLIVTPIVAIPLLIVLMIIVAIKYRKR